jgi:CDP-diacylglycerol--serine O-phosphatidyltransferase
MGLKERLRDPHSPDRRPRRAAYALPTLFTAGNIFLGYIAILRSVRGVVAVHDGRAQEQFVGAAIAIGGAFFLDGLDGRIARLTNTTSDFGREMDSLADVISFGIAPAILAFVWGVHFVDSSLPGSGLKHLHDIGAFVSFLFLLCGAARLARFNVQKNPVPKNPGKPDRKYFVGMPIPAAAAMVAAVVFASGGEPLVWWPLSAIWLGLLALLGFLMVSTWRYHSFKGVSLSKAYSPLLIVLLGALIYGIWNYAQPVLLALAGTYVASGIVTRIAGIVRRRILKLPRHVPPPQEHGVG